ncbi:MAG: hypothetical protein AVDCRST_MAG76-1713, partial [uncultured Acidimicrobiales bacterium]
APDRGTRPARAQPADLGVAGCDRGPGPLLGGDDGGRRRLRRPRPDRPLLARAVPRRPSPRRRPLPL